MQPGTEPFRLTVVPVGFSRFGGFSLQYNNISVIMKLFGAGPKSHAGADEKLVIYFHWPKS